MRIYTENPNIYNAYMHACLDLDYKYNAYKKP